MAPLPECGASNSVSCTFDGLRLWSTNMLLSSRNVSASSISVDSAFFAMQGPINTRADFDPNLCRAILAVATIGDVKDTPKVKEEVYNGNIVIIDIGRLKMDKITYERVLKDLKDVAKDVNGDIVGLGDQRYVVITPMSVKIARDKIGGGTT